MLLAKFSSKAGASAWCGLDLWLVTSDGGLLTRVTFTDGGFGPGCIRLCTALVTISNKPWLRMVLGKPSFKKTIFLLTFVNKDFPPPPNY